MARANNTSPQILRHVERWGISWMQRGATPQRCSSKKKKKAQPGLSPLLPLPVPSLLNFTLFNEDAQLCSAIAGCWHSPKHAHRAEKVSAPSGVVQRGPSDAHQLHVRHPLSTLSTAQGGVPWHSASSRALHRCGGST